MQKPSIPKGTRDFSPREMAERNYIFETIQDVFRLFGFVQIETPAMEKLSTLLGKYGEEGDKLLFKILNSGNYLAGIQNDNLNTTDINSLTSLICEKGLRYDLTVPFARYVVQHRNEVTFPFKRYQIQPVWRADKPQKGRYREFYQCDADIIGSNSLINEVELIEVIEMVFTKLEIKTLLKLNNRKILYGIAEYTGYTDKITDITVAIDKLEKIGLTKVIEELKEKGFNAEAIDKLIPILELKGNNRDKMKTLEAYLKNSEVGKKGLAEMLYILNMAKNQNISTEIEFDPSLARGLNYYTGTIFEVKAKDVNIGSICGGGRYDDLTGIFGLNDVSGVGISFGADRIYDVMKECDLFPEYVSETTKVLILNFGEKEQESGITYLNKLRMQNIRSEIYPDSVKLKKQMTYANNKNIPYVIMIGEDEIKSEKLTLKNMKTGEQQMITFDKLVELLR